MKTPLFLFQMLFGTAMFLLIAGCERTDPGSSTAGPPAPEGNSADHEMSSDDHMDHDHGDQEVTDSEGKTDMDKMTEALASFSDEDRQSALKQHFCPVSGEMLGTMGAPKKVDVNGTNVWICCDGCKDKLLAEPDKYLSKINQ